MKLASVENTIRIVLQLSKVKITVAVALTTIAGYISASGKFEPGIIPVTIGIFLLACGASVMNHIQEQHTDAMMQRTKDRPLPVGKVSTRWALALFAAEIVTGALLLILMVNKLALALGFLAVLWYNLIYTYLKRITPHAVIPGSVIGAIPPLIGWVAAGGLLTDIKAWALAFFFFSWQVPHFYLLTLKYGPQYEKARIPALTSRYNVREIQLMICLWILVTGFSALLLYYFSVVHSLISMFVIVMASIWIIVMFLLPLLRPAMAFNSFQYFMRINYYVLVVVITLIFDHLLVTYFF